MASDYTLRREKYKNKYYMVLRYNGKILDKKKWSRYTMLYEKGGYKSINKETAHDLRKENNSLSDDRRSNLLSKKKGALFENTVIINDTRHQKPRNTPSSAVRKKRYMVQIRFSYRRKEFVARSDLDENLSYNEKRDQAMHRAFGLLNSHLNIAYDNNEIRKAAEKGKFNYIEEVVYYGQS